ncbi:hypothetical protein SteCoe_25633 [Stentor coeruleus]|uniref:Uncharacterized protein n=1 Tax=Stentor coeruleus TaxID=5963 RepID=A0A1R2BEX3_9CILI|nr:hypothetical protein SteCoe_25633 [Stentor coeruleus]
MNKLFEEISNLTNMELEFLSRNMNNYIEKAFAKFPETNQPPTEILPIKRQQKPAEPPVKIPKIEAQHSEPQKKLSKVSDSESNLSEDSDSDSIGISLGNSDSEQVESPEAKTKEPDFDIDSIKRTNEDVQLLLEKLTSEEFSADIILAKLIEMFSDNFDSSAFAIITNTNMPKSVKSYLNKPISPTKENAAKDLLRILKKNSEIYCKNKEVKTWECLDSRLKEAIFKKSEKELLATFKRILESMQGSIKDEEYKIVQGIVSKVAGFCKENKNEEIKNKGRTIIEAWKRIRGGLSQDKTKKNR